MSATCANPRYTGLIVGHERGRIDRMRGASRPPQDLWVPPGAAPEFIAALHAGYLRGVRGEALPEWEDTAHADS